MSEKKVNVTTKDNNVIIRREANAGEEKIFGDNNKVWISGIIEEELQKLTKIGGIVGLKYENKHRLSK